MIGSLASCQDHTVRPAPPSPGWRFFSADLSARQPARCV